MKDLIVSIERNGKMMPAGTILSSETAPLGEERNSL